jgi:hypothetical protein
MGAEHVQHILLVQQWGEEEEGDLLTLAETISAVSQM